MLPASMEHSLIGLIPASCWLASLFVIISDILYSEPIPSIIPANFWREPPREFFKMDNCPQLPGMTRMSNDYLTFVPAGILSSIVRSSRTSLSPAAKTMPCDSIPISFAGLRLATTTMVRPTNSSGAYFFPMPATI